MTVQRAAGIDTSHHVPVKDWDALYDSGVRFVGVKATEGLSYVDPTFRSHRDELRRRPFLLAIYYHFARSGAAQKQAERLLDVVGQLRDNERLCLDLEVSPTPNPRDGAAWVEDFICALKMGMPDERKIIVYTSDRVWRELDDRPLSVAGWTDLWAPRYNDEGAEPIPASPWADVGWQFWQFSDGDWPPHVTPGVGACDASWFRGDDAALAEYAKIGIPQSVA